MKKLISLVSCAALTLGLLSCPLVEESVATDPFSVSRQSTLSKKEAQRLVNDTWILQVCGGIEATEANAHFENPKNVALIAIYGLYNTGSNAMISRDQNPAVFKGVPQDYMLFFSRQSVERAALRFTGHTLTRHLAPSEQFLLTRTGYFCSYLGDPGLGGKPHVKKISQQGSGYIFSGITTPEDPDDKPGTFSMKVVPGDVAGSWKRVYLKY